MATWQEDWQNVLDRESTRGIANMPEVLLGDNRWTTESLIQQPSNPGAGAMFPLLTYGTGLALGNTYDKGYLADMLTPNVNSVPMEGPMRFAGRGTPSERGPLADYYPGTDYNAGPEAATEAVQSEDKSNWRPDLAGTEDHSQWTEDNPVIISYDARGKPYPYYGFEGGIPDISMLDYGIDVPGGQGVGNAAGDHSIFGSPYPGYLNDNRDAMSPHYPDEYSTIRPETAYPPRSTIASGTDTRSEWQKWKDSFRKDW